MFRNYLLTAIRNIRRNRIFSTINVLGLSIGITASLVIFMIVYYEFTFDKFQEDKERVYRVVLDAKFNGVEGHSTGVMAPLAGAMNSEIPGLDLIIPVMYFQGDGTVDVRIGTEDKPASILKKQSGIIFTNPAYFEMLGYQFLAGKAFSLNQPFHTVLTETRARQYFPGKTFTEIIGTRLAYDKDLTVTITGVVADLNQNTAFTSEEFISYATIAETALKENFMMNVWNDWMAYSHLYIKLEQNSSKAAIENSLQGLLKRHDDTHNTNEANTLQIKLQPLADMHFNQKYQGFGHRLAHKPTMYGLLAISGFLLLLACINFVNLTTAQSSGRAREIGIRKTLGGIRLQLFFQFLGETFILTLIAAVVSLLLIPLMLKMFNDFIPAGLNLSILNQPGVLIFFALLVIFVSLLSGIYPALILSGFKPVAVLKNQTMAGSNTRSSILRKTLTVSQFVIAQFFVIATLMVAKQIKYSLDADLGFNQKAIINFEVPRDTIDSNDRELLTKIRMLQGVEVAAAGFLTPASQGAAFTHATAVINGKEITPEVNVQIRWGTTDYINVYQIPLIAGRNVHPSDTVREYLVNESYVRSLGLSRPEDVLNQFIKKRDRLIPIVGVMRDFHDQSMHGHINAMIFAGQKGDFFHVRLKNSDENAATWKATISSIDALYRKSFPGEIFNYSFLDDTLAKLYQREKDTARLLTWATGLAITISCLGLAGLVIYTTNTRRKEIGIRKVMGATAIQITSTLSKDFLKLVLLAFVIAIPLCYWAISEWLTNFVYRTPISLMVFAAGGAGMLLIAFLTISFQTIRAARSNPVESLRAE